MEKRKGSDEKIRSVKNNWSNFAQDTTLHGIKGSTNNSKPGFIRFLWVLVVLAGFAGWLYTSFDLVVQIRKYKTRTISKREYRGSLEFPTITLCPACPINFEGMNLSTDVKNLLLSTIKWGHLLQDMELNATALRFDFLSELIANSVITMENTIYQIRWDGENIPLIPTLTTLPISDKQCFQFNGEHYQNRHGRFVSDQGGIREGFEVIANVGQSGCPASVFDSAGLEVYIQSPKDRAVPRSPDLVLAPGTSTYISLKLSQTWFLPYPYKSFDDTYCIDTELIQHRNYSKINCQTDCFEKELEKICPCTVDSIFADSKDIVVDECHNVTLAVACWSDNRERVYKLVESGGLCSCPEACIKTEYRHDFSFAYFPTDALSEKLLEMGYITDPNYARKNLLKFNINYKDMSVDIVEYIPEYGSSEILGIVGGHLGLFLGASLITGIEIIETILLMIYYKIKHAMCHQHKIHNNTIETSASISNF